MLKQIKEGSDETGSCVSDKVDSNSRRDSSNGEVFSEAGASKASPALLPTDDQAQADPYRDVPIPVYVWRRQETDFILVDFNKAADALTAGKIRRYKGAKASDYLSGDPESLKYLHLCFEQKTVLRREGSYKMQTTGESKCLVIQWVYSAPDSVIVNILDITESRRIGEENRILARFPEDSPNPILRVDPSGTIQYANASASALLEAWNCSVGGRLPESWEEILARVLKKSESMGFEMAAGERVYHMTVHAVNTAESVYVYGDDITDLKQAEEKLELSDQVFESTIEGILLTDLSGLIISTNTAFSTIMGYGMGEVLGQTPALFKSDRHDEGFYREVLDSLNEQGVWQGEVWGRKKNEEVCPLWLSINQANDKNGKAKSYVAVFNDISELKKTQDQIEHQAFHDILTDLPNRLLFNDRLDQALKRARRTGERFALLYLDLDRFKNVNDSLGHTVGDRLLGTVAGRLLAKMRASDTVARLGGDEFVILMPQIQATHDLFATAERVLRVFHEPFSLQDREFFVTASIGISVFPEDGDDATELVRNADLAMYHAKKLGGDRFQLFSAKMHQEVIQRIHLEHHLHRALDLQQLRVYYQPVIDVSTGRSSGAEALLRWDHPEMGAVSPVKFIPLAEETGLIFSIGAWVLRRACQQAKIWQEGATKGMYASVNVSACQLTDRGFPDDLRRIMTQTQICGDDLTLEITENMLMTASDNAVEVLKELKKTGVRISIDDFGTGYSSLSYLKRFPIDTLKIDRSFVVDLPGDRESVAIARSIVALAKNLGLEVLAEGVETQEQFQFLAEAGCDRIQGYYFSRPVPADQIRPEYPLH